jgi:hypothetical protein
MPSTITEESPAAETGPAFDRFFTDVIAPACTLPQVQARRQAVRGLLERVRDGAASETEIDAIQARIRWMNDNPESPEDERRTYVLVMAYLAPEPLEAVELADALNVSKRTIHRDIAAAIDRLTVLLFGVDGIVWK